MTYLFLGPLPWFIEPRKSSQVPFQSDLLPSSLSWLRNELFLREMGQGGCPIPPHVSETQTMAWLKVRQDRAALGKGIQEVSPNPAVLPRPYSIGES